MAAEVKGGVEVLDILLELERRPADDPTPVPDPVTQCTELELKNRDIQFIPSTIDRCTNLKKINLEHNKLKTLPRSMFKLKNLTHLNLSFNQFTELPATVCALPHIENLKLPNNKISSLPPDISKMTTLKSLDLGWNRFTELPTSVFALPHIENMNLRGNKLSSLPTDISKVTTLKSLKLGWNQITEIPVSICDLPHIEHLKLPYNKLSSLPPYISKMTSLKSLNLGGNQITELPASVCALPHIENLNLWGNKLSSLPPDVCKMTSLKFLNLRGNQIKELPASLCALPRIENLKAGGNKLSSLPSDVRKMSTLKSLNIGFNQFAELPASVFALPHIEHLDLRYNKLSSLPSDISNVTTLKSLNLSHNNIACLPHQLSSLPLLENLVVDANPIQQPPYSVCRKGKDAILRYLTELRESKAVQSCRLQLNFLGETESGKTSLARSLRHRIPMLTELADRTRVVEQSEWEIEGGISFNINDFGGHDVYRVGHSIFISQNSIVLVTFDLSTYDPCSRSHFRRHIGIWIDMVHSHNPDVKIALVGTHVDKIDEATGENVRASIQKSIADERRKRQEWCHKQNRDLKERIQALQKDKTKVLITAYRKKIESLDNASGYEKSKIHPHIFMLSSKTQAGFRPLTDYLATQARESSITLPKTWHKAAMTICSKREKKTENTLGGDIVKQEIKNSVSVRNVALYFMKKLRQQTDDIANDILAFLVSRGDIIWYPNNPILRNTIFHRQEVLADLLKAVLNHDKGEFKEILGQMSVSEPMAERIREDFSMRGIVSEQVMEAMWKPFGVTDREASAMVELMQRLELCFKVNEGKNGATFHFPWLLELSRPSTMDTEWPKSVPANTIQVTLNVYFPYGCPDGLYEKLSVRLHSTLGLYQPMRRDWRDGVFVDMGSQYMQMTRSQTDKDWVITIAVRGQHIPDLWRTLLQNHDHLMNILEEDWPGLPCDKYLVCPHCTSLDVDTPTLFPGEVIDQPPATTADLVPCWNTGKMIPANLICPNMPAMKPHQKHALKQHMELLVHNITKPCLSYLLDMLMQEGVITDREKEYVHSKPSIGDTEEAKGAAAAASEVSPEQTRTLLNILLTKEERAFKYLCRCLEKNGQGFLAEKLKRP
ncbi:malignant fibrous histiocytoma-amplified sequence 1 homolog [Lingula anatina]|uniref:Malignant fibrous histiocytoma-amplified sequence 1 homolog n=1 Tax=Lingula anatina TaxID=7574 RepID=A0A1S3HJK6_LINAN|nr:malignant fibrous histiocytoma-amplified sequence 1 homolog [Lingula anatina]|eukprot:XP_013386197.1 malignant fibrous histiocytoma-amplified sequence 1 homolog [Lingula anatina]